MNLPPLHHAFTDWAVATVFGVVYLGMFLGGLPRLRLDRTGVALLGAIAMMAITGMTVNQAASAIDVTTLLLLFAFMVISAQMRLGGFYAAVTLKVGAMPLSRPALLAALIAIAGVLSAVFSNDVICLAMTPVVLRLCLQRGLPPVPFLVGLACAANIGSAATLIGNPQNMLIGSVLALDFADYAVRAAAPVAGGLLVLWVWLAWGPGQSRSDALVLPTLPLAADPPFDAWQTTKGLTVVGVLMVLFLFTDAPHAVLALVGAALLLLSRRLASSDVIGLVDWSLLVLFMGLFVVNHAFESTGMAAEAVRWLASRGVVLHEPGTLMVAGVVLSNLVSNVPAVMLLLPHLQDNASGAGLQLALVTTFAGNLLLVGSIANLIVADLAGQQGVHIGWREHARIGVPVTLLSLGLVWMALR
ncbi:SLC13 family permease [uncultured Hydrogenophaga sp.]|uniref:SLC13 family permease n=1 Tax=uncultured Hydrogenophaga sp. TaxID=199683 RepID=UPI00265DC061|nr:SLC13 family permease [uncultured Hydrogenophaga sp.]